MLNNGTHDFQCEENMYITYYILHMNVSQIKDITVYTLKILAKICVVEFLFKKS